MDKMITKLHTLDDGTVEERQVVDPKLRSTGPWKDDRQDVAWDNYIKSWRAGKPNAKQAGLDAGYAPNTALNLGNLAWFKKKKDKLRRSTMMSRAERNLSRILSMDYSKMKLKDDGTEEEVIDKDILRVVADISKTIVTTLGKDEGYSSKTEIKGDMSGEIKINSISYADPIELENKIVDDTIKQVEEHIIRDVIVKEDENIL
jgi:hypothetical protein